MLRELLHQHHVQLAHIIRQLVKLRACLARQDSSAMNWECQMILSRYKTSNATQDITVLILVLKQPQASQLLPLETQFLMLSYVQVVTSVRQDQRHRLFVPKAITNQEKVPMIAKNAQPVTTAHSQL